MKTSPAAELPPAEGLVRALRQALRGAPAVAREAGFPRTWWRHLGEQGLLGLSFDLDGRGPRADWPTIARLAGCMARETGRLGLTLGWMLNEMLGRCVIGSAGNESERVRALLRRMAAGQAIVGLAVSEPDAGAHPKRLRCSARREQDGKPRCRHRRWSGRRPRPQKIEVARSQEILNAVLEFIGQRHFRDRCFD